MFFKSLVKHFRGFGSGFAELQANLDADTCSNFSVNHKQNERLSRKSTDVKTISVHSAASYGRLMQGYCGSVTLASLLVFFHLGLQQ
jgi:hypothetical protein